MLTDITVNKKLNLTALTLVKVGTQVVALFFISGNILP